ncbi:MAG: monovalent cation/H(+) antiporter subunit G [Gemmatimonadota bacterium]|nr:monovalent cation/H(+) antiporter subunit G [Gemmatimonadota bacterium]
MMVNDVASWACLLLGSFFCIVGGIGLIRLPDFYSRMHGAGVTDTFGAGLLLVGLMLQGGLSMVTVKLLLILLLVFLTGPASTHAVAKAAFTSGLKPLGQEDNHQP